MQTFRSFGWSLFSSILFLFSANALSQGPWNFQNSNEGWVGKNSTFTTGAEYSTWTLNGASRWNRIRIATDIDTSSTGQYLAVTLKNETGNTHFAVGANITGNDASYGFLSPKPEIDPNQTEFSTVYIDMDSHPRWNGTNTITSLYLRLRNHATNNGTSSWETGSVQIKKIEFLSALPANPTMTITSTTAGVTDGSTTGDSTINMTFTSSEATADFVSSDVTTTGGSISNFSATSSTVYTATFTPSGEGATTIDVAANAYTGSTTGLGNTAADQFNWTYAVVDVTAPNLSTETAISTPDNDSTPSFIFASDEVGTITSSLAFSSTTTALAGNNTVTFSALSDGVYYGETITVTDSSGNAGSLTIPTFFIDTTAPAISNVAISSDNATSTLAKVSDDVTLTFSVNKSLERTPTVVFSSGGDAATANDSVTNDGGNYTITVPSNKSGNVGGALASSFVDRGLTFVRPPVNSEAPQATWGTATGQDTARVGTNLYFRKFTWSNASSWCESINGRLATDAEVTKHLIPLLGSSSNGYWEAELKWPQRSSHYWTASVAGDNTTDPATRHKAFITKNTSNGNDVYELQGRADTNTLWPLCVVNFERNFTSTYTVDESDTDGAVTYTVDVRGALGNNATQVTSGSGNVTVDKSSPTMTITSSTVSSGDTSNDASIALIFTSSEATTNFAVGDITVTGGTLSNFASSSSTVYTATFTASSNGATSIDVAAGTYTDATGNSNTEATQFTWTMDAVPPTMVVTSSTVSNGDTSNDSTIALTFTSSEATTNFAEGDITVSGGSLSDFSATSATVYTATFTPSSDGETTVDVGAGSFTDAYGNNNSAASQFSWTYDGTGPTMVVTSATVSDGATSNDSSIALTFTSSEATTNFVESDITVSGGSLSNFATSSSTIYTATFTPSSDGATTIDIGAGTYTDAYGNNSSAASQFNWTYDSTAPSLATVTAVATPGNDTTPSFVFSSDEAGTITTDITEGFSTSTSASSGNNSITFNTLDDGTYSGKTITVTDAAGNANSLTIPDFVIETVAPTMTISSATVTSGDTSNDDSISLTFTSNEATTNFVVGDVTVSGGSLSNFAASSTSVYTATFTPSSAGGTSVDVAAGVFTDAAGNGNTAASQFTWTYDNSSAELSNVKISSNNATSTLAKIGDLAFLSFTANEPINTPTISFASGGEAIAANRVTVSNEIGNTWSASFIFVSSDTEGAVTYSIAYSDSSGNEGAPVTSGSGSVTFDKTRPVSSISNAQVGNGGATNVGSIDFTFGLSDSTTEFSASDVSVSGGTLSNFSGSGKDYSATFTSDGDGTKTIQIVRAAYTDAAGNVSWATGEFSFTYDGTFPTIDVSNMYSKIIDGMTDLGTATADEDVTWSISGTGVSISSSGTVTLDSPADHLVAESHTFTISASDSVGNNRHVTMTVEVGDVTAPTIDYSNLVHTIDEGETALGYVTSSETVTWSIEGAGVSISSDGVVTLDSPASYAEASTHSYRVTATDEEGIFREGFLFTVFVNDTTAPVITLVGSASIESELGYTYTDEGATAVDNKDGTITSEITTVNSVDVDTEGTYTVTYDVTDAAGNVATQVVRTVTVTPDATLPVISLSGDSSVTVEAATSYTDDGASATDNIDGDVSASITTVNNVDINVPGTYSVTYNVSDSAGNAATEVVRTVNVVDTTAPVITLSGGSEGTTAETPYSTNDPVGNGPDGKLNTADDVVIKDLFAVEGLTFVRPPLGGEAAAGTWGTAAGRDLNRVGTNRYFRKFTWEKARDWCVSINARLATGAEITSHIIPVVGPSSDGTWESELNWPQQASHYWTGSIAGDDDGSESRHKAFITYNTNNGNSVHQVQGRANTNAFWPLCVIETETASEGSASITHEQGTTYTDAGATALDSVDGVVEVETTGSVDDATAGTYVLTYTATDNAGNSATRDRTVTVADTVSPVITLVGDAALSFEVAPSGTVYEDAGATATDGADGDISANITVTGSVDLTSVGTYTLTYSLTDAAGNEATSVTRTITVTPDVTVPTITLLGDSAQSYEMGTAYVDAGATAVDNIDGDITSQIVLTISNSSGATLSSVDILTPDTYTLTYSVEDATGNAAVSVIRIVEITPDVTIPVITLVGESSITLERYTPYVDAGATATDNIDGDITSSIVTINTVDTTNVGTYVITYNVSDGYGNTAAEVSRTVTIIPIAISLSAPSDITVAATGHLTYVDIGSASVSAGEGEVTVSPSQMGPFESGMYEITWTAEDSVGTTAVALQKVKVIPMVNLGPAMTVTEGNSLQIPVSLSGHLADASMSVNYSITGTAIETEDYVSAGTAVMIEGSDMAAMINIDIVADAVAESDETLTITLIPESLTGAGPGSTMEQMITISEQDLPPKVSMHASQASVMPITTVAKDSGMVDVVASASDPNSGSSFTYTWGGAYNTLPGVIDNGNTLSFDPSTMDSGVISVSVEVSDGVNTTMASILLNIVTSMPTLSADNDSDGDGVDDLTEGVGDDDMDGVPNYLDSITSSNVIPTASSVAQAEAGTSISLGAIALGNGDHDVSVSEADVAVIDTADVGFDYIELSDFVISGAQPGHSYMVTIPLSVPSSSTATYRKYVNENIGWQMFVEDASNMIMSADSSNGVCPAAGSDEYGPGWYIGDDCLQLMIEDGGPNDADGVANGVVIDPSGVAEKFIGTPSSNSSAVLGTNTLDANGTDNTSLTVTVLDGSGNPLEHMSVSGSIGISGATVSAFYEEGEGVYSATVTAGTVAGSDSVSIDISNGQTSVTISSDQLTLNDVTPVTPEEPATGGGGGCSVSTDTSSDNTLIMMLLAAALLLIRRRYYQNQ